MLSQHHPRPDLHAWVNCILFLWKFSLFFDRFLYKQKDFFDASYFLRIVIEPFDFFKEGRFALDVIASDILFKRVFKSVAGQVDES